MNLETQIRAFPSILTIKGKTRVNLLQGGSRWTDVRTYWLLTQGIQTPIFIKDPNRRITVSADMYVEDYETFGSNETTRRQKTNSAILSKKGIAQTVMDFEVRMGGEIRVEFHVTAALWDNDGNAFANGEVKLFEGTSESRGDLDGIRQFQLYVPAGAAVNHFVRVNNDAENDDDYATIALTITNSSI